MPQSRLCVVCAKPLVGNAKRKTCSDRCRSKKRRYDPEYQLRRQAERGAKPSKYDAGLEPGKRKRRYPS